MLILIKISLKFVPKGQINNIQALVKIMAWRRPGDKPSSEPRMESLLTHICVTRPQWYIYIYIFWYCYIYCPVDGVSQVLLWSTWPTEFACIVFWLQALVRWHRKTFNWAHSVDRREIWIALQPCRQSSVLEQAGESGIPAVSRQDAAGCGLPGTYGNHLFIHKPGLKGEEECKRPRTLSLIWINLNRFVDKLLH